MMKKQFRKSVLAVSVLGLMAGMSGSALAASAEGKATAYVIPSLQLSKVTNLAFGTFAAAATAKTVNIDSSCEQGGSAIGFGGESCGIFDVQGYQNASYIVGWDKVITLSGQDDTNSNQTMQATVNLFGNNPRNLNNGIDQLKFGGSLDVAANQAEGNYEGTYTVTANYQ
jgi:hypothetical protein